MPALALIRREHRYHLCLIERSKQIFKPFVSLKIHCLEICCRRLKRTRGKNLYSLDMNHVVWNDLEYGNHFTSTHPSSLFTQNCVVVRPTDDGITTLFNRTLKVRQGLVEQEF